jgi:hypothetical protein
MPGASRFDAANPRHELASYGRGPVDSRSDSKTVALTSISGSVKTALVVLIAAAIFGAAPASPQQTPRTSQPNAPGSSLSPPDLPRGKKLILKDGSFQLVREYQVDGDRLRYYSIDSSQWDEMPADLVDWDKTKAVAAEEASRDAAAVAKARATEVARHAQPLDIDASVEAAPGVFLPPGEGLFSFDGKTVLKLAQASIDSKLVKKKVVEQIFVPVPIVPTQHNITIHRPHAEYRVENGQPEFYMRLADAQEPDLELIRATTHGDSREIEKLDQLFGQKRLRKSTLPMQRWQVAPGLYRFTLGTPLEPGEYALAEVVEDSGISLYVWDFGVDAGKKPEAAKTK